MKRRKLYSHRLAGAIDERLPVNLLDAMNAVGWNALGVYEVVLEEIAKLKKRQAASMASAVEDVKSSTGSNL